MEGPLVEVWAQLLKEMRYVVGPGGPAVEGPLVQVWAQLLKETRYVVGPGGPLVLMGLLGGRRKSAGEENSSEEISEQTPQVGRVGPMLHLQMSGGAVQWTTR